MEIARRKALNQAAYHARQSQQNQQELIQLREKVSELEHQAREDKDELLTFEAEN